jgi:serine phosphatase RsbU (regulator of sigma subunit)
MSDKRRFCWEITVDCCGGNASKRLRLRERETIGRDQDNGISLSETMVSRRHAEFQQRDGSLYIIDLGSTNGTYVNGVRVHSETILRDSDVISLGGATLVCHETAIEAESEDEDDVVHGVVKTTVRRELTMRLMRRVVDVSSLVEEDRSLSVVCQAANALVADGPLSELFDRVLEAILKAIPAQRGAIMLLEGQPLVPNLKATRTLAGTDLGEISRDIVHRVVERREAFLVRDLLEDAELRRRADMSTDSIRSVMCAPLWSNFGGTADGRVLGLIYLDNLDDRPPLTDRDLHVLIMLANITATKVENARLMEENQQKKRMEEDIMRAAAIQADLLPRSSPVVPGYSVCGATVPCRTVGGDYFDFEHDGRTLHIALADVSGKGTGAAMLMVALRATVRAHWREGSLTEATSRINRTFFQTVPPDKYATFFVARLDHETGRLDYVNAGHNRPLLIQPNGEWLRLEAGGTVVGAFPEAVYEQGTVVLGPGSCLLVFSDGISDAWHDEAAADRHLVGLALDRKPGDATALRSAIFQPVEQANDDRTLIVVERLADATA